MKDLLNELEIMVQVGQHKNIVNLIGACASGGELFTENNTISDWSLC